MTEQRSDLMTINDAEGIMTAKRIDGHFSGLMTALLNFAEHSNLMVPSHLPRPASCELPAALL